MKLNLVEYVLVVCLLCAFWIYNGAPTWKQPTQPTKAGHVKP